MLNLLTEEVVDQIILVRKVLVTLAELLQVLVLVGHQVALLQAGLRLRQDHLRVVLALHLDHLEKDNSKKNNYYESKATFCNTIPMQSSDNCSVIELC